MQTLLSTIPVFPLRGALLLPSGNLPLNIFEPIYLAMINYAFKHDKLIGMIQPKSSDSKELYKTGCIGKITNYNETDDNRYVINLKGISKFKIINEIKHNEEFRVFKVEIEESKIHFDKFDKNLFMKEKFIEKIMFFLDKKGLSINLKSLEKIKDQSLIVTIAMICPFSTNEKQVLLESKNINDLANNILSLLEFEINQKDNHETIN